MSISYEEAVRAQMEIEDKFLEDPNVVSVGVVEEIDGFGGGTGNYAITVGVISAEIYQNALDRGQSIIPQEYRLCPENENQEIKCVHIKVVETGPIEALSTSNELRNKDLPSAINGRLPATLQTLDGPTSRRRPSSCGQNIGHPAVSYSNKYLSWKTRTFASDYPLRVLRRSYSTSSALYFSRNSGCLIAQGLKAIPMKYGAIFASIGIYAVTTKLANQLHSDAPVKQTRHDEVAKKTHGLLSRALSSCCFFRFTSSPETGLSANVDDGINEVIVGALC